MRMSMKKVVGLAIVAAGALGGCAYEPPPPYAYFPVPCAPAGATVTPTAPPVAAAPGPVVTPAGPGQCVAVVPTYVYPAYYPYPGYYYPGYYGPPAYGSMFIGGHFH
ncbi:MAG TPA: hypothetical protein VMQ11_10435 [Alphaproteobacteria bacterium]|nr:hypothetical protein [Alphaproteobacteria bacterium]